ncbi:MAG: co-chaperone GroES [Vigna little leaf phytoplasma]|nr:co-chaperone GroES [Vigna little leaf phytoplasma]
MSTLKIKPINDYIVLKYKKEEQKTAQGIYLTTEDQNKDSIGIVVNCGPKVTEIKPNDEVVYKNYSGTKIKVENQDYLIIKLEDILAILEN